ncbi:hypothetical protein BMI87_15885 [Thioclava sp. F28-4]|nr:hypothetical protein BMI87_15885 [Thioclava sp. F28-4]
MKTAILLAFLVLLFWGGNWIVASSTNEPGVFGDQFGAVNALFTGLAFAAVIYAILLQRVEISLVRDELDRTKGILEEQQNLAQLQVSAQSKQIFESTFFNLLNVFSEIVQSMDLKSKELPDVTGRDVFPVFLKRLRSQDPLKTAGMYPSTDKGPGEAEEAYEKFYGQYKSELGHYFRTLYNLYKFVDSSEVEDKRLYTNLIRAQLSDDEALMLFINGLSPRGSKFKPLLEKYSVLKNVDLEDRIVIRAKGRTEYAPSAFD